MSANLEGAIDLYDRLTGVTDPIIVFVGAGASKASPSGIPLASELRSMIVTAISDGLDIPEHLLTRIHYSLVEARFPLEHFVYIGYKVFGKDFINIFTKLQVSGTNINDFHLWLAWAVKKGYVKAILTTNFDEYIEMALINAGLVRSENSKYITDQSPSRQGSPIEYFKVIASQDDFELLASNGSKDLSNLFATAHIGDTVPVIKIHGTWSNPNTIVTTIEGYQSYFIRPRLNAVRELMAEDPTDCLFVGYSGSDEVFSVIKKRKFRSIYWLTPHGSDLSNSVIDFITGNSGKLVERYAEVFARELLENYGIRPIDSRSELDSLHNDQMKNLTKWASEWPTMQRFNFLAKLELRLGCYSDVKDIIRRGFERADSEKAEEISPIIYGLYLISRAKSELGEIEEAFADIDRALKDWMDIKQPNPNIAADIYGYINAEMLMHRGWVYLLRDQNIFDQIAAWDDLKAAYTIFLEWHDRNFAARNFESSPEFAEVSWYIGLFSLKGGDLKLAENNFWRMYDVDAFDDLQIMTANRMFGFALVREAEGIRAKEIQYGEGIAQNAFRYAIELGKNALAFASAYHHPELIADILLFLGENCERIGDSEAETYYKSAEQRFRFWNGDSKKAEYARSKYESCKKTFKEHDIQ